jgi:hypothetical protein
MILIGLRPSILIKLRLKGSFKKNAASLKKLNKINPNLEYLKYLEFLDCPKMTSRN